jgi:hypothetical protein
MVYPHIVDRGEELQIWRVTADILNNQSQTANKEWSYSLGVEGANNSPPYKTNML